MKQIQIHVREKTKKSKNLSLLNLKDEVVNVLYKDTIANSTKYDLQAYVLLYFAALKIGEATFLEKILDEGVPKFDALVKSFSDHQGYLRVREYRAMVEKHGLEELFENDIFFILVGGLLNLEEVKPVLHTQYEDNDEEFERLVKALREKYIPSLKASLKEFTDTKIKDDRYDEFGNYHDLSKSVFRTVQMRNSRNLVLNLQRYTAVKEISSSSPLDLSFIQFVDPQIVFDLWTKYHVAEYMRSIWKAANTPLISQGLVGILIYKYTEHKRINGRTDPKEKRKAKKELEISKIQNGKQLEDLSLELVSSVLKANERLENEIKGLRKELADYRQRVSASEDDNVKRLEDRIAHLENLSIETEVID